MVQRIGGSRRKSRAKFSKPARQKGKMSVSKFFQSFDTGSRVALVAEPAHQKGLYHARFHGNNGVIEGTQGDCYKVKISDGNKKKLLLVHPVHLKRL
jgi:large subunit ribosomal protein L21e